MLFIYLFISLKSIVTICNNNTDKIRCSYNDDLETLSLY